MQADKLLYRIALTKINGIGDMLARSLLNAVGNEEGIFKSSRKSLLNIPYITSRLVDEIKNSDVMNQAEKELDFVVKNKIKTYFFTDSDYPARLKECPDSPVLFYFKGNANLNAGKIISIVGTRQSSNYGNGFCNEFIKDLSLRIPDVLIVSGLAYGIDVSAHKAALNYKIPTLGILAHGLDRIYPNAHRGIASDMLENGGLLTEFPSNTEPGKFNFVKRNRIIAGLADAVIVVESGNKGGSLITAEIAGSYCRDIFAVPGRLSDTNSSGCNKLIACHKADIFYSTTHFLEQMGWDQPSNQQKNSPVQQSLFVDLTNEEKCILNAIETVDEIHIDNLIIKTGLPAYQILPVLLNLEIKGLIKNMPGNLYKINIPLNN